MSLKPFNPDTNTDLRGHKHHSFHVGPALFSIGLSSLPEDVSCSQWSLHWFPSLFYMTPPAFLRTEISISLVIKVANPTHRHKLWRWKTTCMLNVELRPCFKCDLLGYPQRSSAPNHPLFSEIFSLISNSSWKPKWISNSLIHVLGDSSFILLDWKTSDLQTIFILMYFKMVLVLFLNKI